MRDRLMANQETLDRWTSHAEAVGLDVARFEECMNGSRQAAKIRADMAQADKAGVTGTPAFFLAYTDPKSTKITTVTKLSGAHPYATFKAAIDKLLAGSPAARKDAGKGK